MLRRGVENTWTPWGNHVGTHGKSRGPPGAITWAPRGPFECRFQKIARRDKKAFLSDQCKEIEENNRMGKTRDLFKKKRYTKGIFHAKMSIVWT